MGVPAFVKRLREKIGHDLLWLPGVTAVVRHGDEILLVRRADSGLWAPVTGILEPGEEPAIGARREVMEETGVTVRVERLALVAATPAWTLTNGDNVTYLDHTFACMWVSGDAHVADEESVDVAWYHVRDLPDMHERFVARIEAAMSNQTAARFVT